MTRFRRLLVLVVVLSILNSFSSPAFACWICKKSPNGWGFCRDGYASGYTSCKDVVVDEFSGRTGCEFDERTICGISDGCPGCEPTVVISSLPCSWTDRAASALL
jgi:hypothetical protein